MNREHLLSLTALAVVAALTQPARAEDYASNNAEPLALSQAEAQPMTCAQATAFAWFKRQMELTDGDTDVTVPVPAECQPTYLANSSNRDDDASK